MNKTRVNRNNSNGMTATCTNKKEKENEGITNNKKDLQQKTESSAESDNGSGDGLKKQTNVNNNNGTQKLNVSKRRGFSPRRNKLVTHLENKRGPNYVHKDQQPNSPQQFNNGGNSKTSTGTMTIPHLMLSPQNFQQKVPNGQYQYNFEFLHEVGMQIANASTRQALSSSMYRHSNNNNNIPVAELRPMSSSSSSSSVGSNSQNQQQYSPYNSFAGYPQYYNHNGGGNYQQQRNKYNNANNNGNKNNNNNYRHNRKQWNNWNNNNNENNNYRQNNRAGNRYSNDLNNANLNNNNAFTKTREKLPPRNLVYVNTNMYSCNPNNRPTTPNFNPNFPPLQMKSPEISTSDVEFHRSRSVRSSSEHSGTHSGSDSDSGTSSDIINTSKVSTYSEVSKRSTYSEVSKGSTYSEVSKGSCEATELTPPMNEMIQLSPFKQWDYYPRHPSAEIIQNSKTSPYNYIPGRINNNGNNNNNNNNNVIPNVTDGFYTTPPPNMHAGPWVNNNYSFIYGNTNGVQIFSNDPVMDKTESNRFYIENGNMQPQQQQNQQTKKRNSDRNAGQTSNNNQTKSNDNNGGGNAFDPTNSFIATPTNMFRHKHPFSHIVRFSPNLQRENLIHAFYPHDLFLVKAHLMYKIEPPIDLCTGSKYDQMSQDIWKKFTSHQQSEEMYRNKLLLWKDLFIAICGMFKRLTIHMVGSTITGFGTDHSDIDMCIVEKSIGSSDPRQESMWVLGKMRECIQQKCKGFDSFNLIHARVPILRFKHTDHKVEVDLNFNNVVGIRNTHLLSAYSQMDWRLRPLVLLVKLWAQHHNINDARNATLSSYSLVLMVIHFLQCGVKPAILPCLQKKYPEKFHPCRDVIMIDLNEELEPHQSGNEQSLGELFIQFLGYYSNFNYSEHAISIRTASVLPVEVCRYAQSSKNDAHQWKVLCIEEPFDLSNTARSVYDTEVFERIKITFHTSWRLLLESNSLDTVFNTPLFTPLCPSSKNDRRQTPSPPYQEYPQEKISDHLMSHIAPQHVVH